jgi:hypothetical protein
VSFPVHPLVVVSIVALFTCLCFFIIWRYDVHHDLQDTTLFLTLYSLASVLYWIWGSTMNHFYNLAPILSLSVVVFMKWLIDTSRLRHYAHAISTFSIALLLTGAYVPSLALYYHTVYDYEKVFADHKSYQWNLDRAQLISTANPRYFSDAVTLIRNYSKGENGIYIISKYDNFLPFLASKYSAMPFFDVPWFVVSNSEVTMCINALKQSRPTYLFVDTDIQRNLNGDIVSALAPMINYLHDESVMRVQRLNDVKKIYSAIENEYELAETSTLLTVLKRKSNSAHE